MAETLDNNPNAEMHKAVAALRAKQRGETVEELPVGNAQVQEPEDEAPVEAAQETAEVAAEAQGADTAEAAEAPAQEAPAEAEEEIQIGDHVFKTQAEAIAYAKRLEQERLIEQAHAAGIREALEAQAQPQVAAPEPEEDFNEQFFTDPKKAFQEAERRATERAVAIVNENQQREKLWNEFLSEYPDIRRKDAERVLQENWSTIGKLTDYEKGKKVLAQKVRAEYAEIIEAAKPRVQLSGQKAALAPSGGSKASVTPQKIVERPLSFAEQMRKLKNK